MKYFEFGKENKELMVLLHGGGTSYLGVLPTAKKIAEKYHVVLLAYDGFNPSEPETVFQSLAYEARGLEDYLIENYGGKVDILYGLSYGCHAYVSSLFESVMHDFSKEAVLRYTHTMTTFFSGGAKTLLDL